jgi:hypothetical protein
MDSDLERDHHAKAAVKKKAGRKPAFFLIGDVLASGLRETFSKLFQNKLMRPIHHIFDGGRAREQALGCCFDLVAGGHVRQMQA